MHETENLLRKQRLFCPEQKCCISATDPWDPALCNPAASKPGERVFSAAEIVDLSPNSEIDFYVSSLAFRMFFFLIKYHPFQIPALCKMI